MARSGSSCSPRPSTSFPTGACGCPTWRTSSAPRPRSKLVNGALLQNERNAIGPAAAAGADVAVVAGAGHVVPVDAPRVFAATVEEFAARIDAGRTAFHERRRAADRAAHSDVSVAEAGEAEEAAHV